MTRPPRPARQRACGRWSAIKADDVTHDEAGPTLRTDQGAFLVCGYDNCRQDFTITGGITALPFGVRHAR